MRVPKLCTLERLMCVGNTRLWRSTRPATVELICSQEITNTGVQKLKKKLKINMTANERGVELAGNDIQTERHSKGEARVLLRNWKKPFKIV